MTIPVICDRCRAAGMAGTGDFAQFGDLLEFEPVQRDRPRVDGWTAERQRAFIALLATTGSPRRASMALAMSPYGIVKLCEAKGAESFNAADDRAMAIAAENGTMKIAQGVADAAARNSQLAQPSRLRGFEPEDDEASGMPEDEKLALVQNIFLKILRKVEAERAARLKGEVVAADFYLRQVTFCEVAFDMMAEGQRAGTPIETLAWAFSCHRGGEACGQCRGCAKQNETLGPLMRVTLHPPSATPQ